MKTSFSSRRGRLWRRWLALLSLFPALAAAEPGCRIAFDLGSTGIRAGASGQSQVAKANIDYLGFLWSEAPLQQIVAPTAEALGRLPQEAGFAADCARVGGGFSFWRLAQQRDPAALSAALEQIHAASGVAVLVVPPAREGAYGFYGARQVLRQIETTHILDIGGGSLEIAGTDSGFSEALGQRTWSRQLCLHLRATPQSGCALQPLSDAELARARAFADAQLRGAAALPQPLTLTSISRPVSRGLLPALRRLAFVDTAERLPLGAISQGIAALAGRSIAETAALTGAAPEHAVFLLSDLLLVEGLLRQTGASELRVAEADLTNLPGLLADDRAYQWAARYACYLQRLSDSGLAAFDSDPATCPSRR